MRIEYLIVSIVIVVVVLVALITFAKGVFPAFPKAISDFLATIGAK